MIMGTDIDWSKKGIIIVIHHVTWRKEEPPEHAESLKRRQSVHSLLFQIGILSLLASIKTMYCVSSFHTYTYIQNTPPSHIYSSATSFIGSAFNLSLALLPSLLSPSLLNLFFTLPERPLCAVVGLSALSSKGRGAVVFADVE